MKRIPALHPFLFAAYAIIAIYAENANEIPTRQILRPLVIILVFTVLIYFITFKATKDH